MVLNKVSDVPAADWPPQTFMKKKLLYVYKVCDTVFLNGGNPYEAPQFISGDLVLVWQTW